MVERNHLVDAMKLQDDDSSSAMSGKDLLLLEFGGLDGELIKMEEVSQQTYSILGKALSLSLGTESGYETEGGSDEPEMWKRKPPESWTCTEVMDWIYDQAAINNAHLPSLRGERFQDVDGQKLCQMTKDDFLSRDETFGALLFQCLQNFRTQNNFNPVSTTQSWHSKHPVDWNGVDVLDWIYYGSGLSDISLVYLKGETFQGVDGRQLCAMSCADFEEHDKDCGSSLFHAFQSFRERFAKPSESSYSSSDGSPCHHPLSLKTILPSTANLQNQPTEVKWVNSKCTSISTPLPCEKKRSQPMGLKRQQKQNSPSRQPSKRPRKSKIIHCEDVSEDNSGPQCKVPKQSSKTRLWKFMRDLLDNPEYNPECIRWENKEEGIFRIVAGRSKVIAELWGKIKNNPTMTFDKLGRSLRWCRANNGKFSTVPKDGKFPRKLCFRLVEPDADEPQAADIKLERSLSTNSMI